MKISPTYRFIASVLSLSILIGVSIPAVVHSMPSEECDLMEEMHDMHQPGQYMEDCPMNSHSAEMPEHQNHPNENNRHFKMFNMGFACACAIEEAPVKTEAPVFQKVKTQVLTVVQVLAENHFNQPESDNHAIQTSDSYSPPPIFLVNESFLN